MITHSFEILGQELKLKSADNNQSDFINVIEYYKKNVEQLKASYPNKPDIEIAILAGIRVTDELHTLAKSKGAQDPINSRFMEEKVSEALKQLENSLN